MTKTQSRLLAAIFMVVYFIGLLYANRPMEGDLFEIRQASTESARVVSVSPAEDVWSFDFQVELLTGPWRGQILEAHFRHNPLYDLEPQVGDLFSVQVTQNEDRVTVLANNPERRQPLLLLIGLFIGSLLLLGGKRGLRAIGGIAFTLSSIFFLLIPLIVRGYPVIATTLIIALLMSVVTILIIGGSLPKMVTAILGTMVGVLCALMTAQIFGRLAHINGLQGEQATTILAATNISHDQMRNLFTSGILIASLGAVLDTSVAIASALEEVRAASPRVSPIKLLRSGMNVGRDAMGTMSNTLILAFVGASLNTVIIFAIGDVSLNLLLNYPYIAMEILRSISGSLGIVFAVPAVSFIGAILLGKRKTNRNSEKFRRVMS